MIALCVALVDANSATGPGSGMRTRCARRAADRSIYMIIAARFGGRPGLSTTPRSWQDFNPGAGPFGLADQPVLFFIISAVMYHLRHVGEVITDAAGTFGSRFGGWPLAWIGVLNFT